MIGLLRVLLVAIPLTIAWGGRIMWAARRRSPDLPCMCDDIPRRWARHLLRASGTRVVLENVEVIDAERPQILVANHTSWFDVLALVAWLPGRSRFVAKDDLKEIPFFGHALDACGHISIDRSDRGRALESLRLAERRIREERPTLVLFPEGTRSDTGALRPFKKGAFVLALQTGVEVVPAAILGSRDVMPKGTFRIRTGRTIRVRFGDPIPVEGLDLEGRDELTERAREAVRGLLEAQT